MRIERRFTTAGQDPYSNIEFRNTTSEIRNPDGSRVFHLPDIDVPADWSQVACDILAQKYFRKAGVPARARAGRRRRRAGLAVAARRRRGARSPGLPADERIRLGEERQAGLRPPRRHLDLLGLEGRLFRQRGRCARLSTTRCATCCAARWRRPTRRNGSTPACIGPTASTARRRAITTSIFETGELTASNSAYEHPQPHACFIQSVADDLVNEGGIMDLWVREARLFKYGSGTGSNFSKLRGENEKLSGGGRSSGLMSFLKIGDRAAGAIKSGGTTRRAAKMVTVDIDHPDIEDLYRLEGASRSRRSRRSSPARSSRSKHLNRHHGGLPRRAQALDDGRFDPGEEPGAEARDQARRAARMIPENYIQRVIQFAQPGLYRDRLPRPTTPTGTAKPISPSPARTRTTRCASPTTSWSASRTTSDWHLIAPHRRQGRARRCRRASCGRRSPTPPGPAPIPGCSTTPRSTSGTPARRAAASTRRTRARNTCSSTTRPAISPRSTCWPSAAATAASTSPAFEHATRLWTIVLEISVLMAQFPSKRDRPALLRIPHAGPGLRQYRRAADGARACPTTAMTAARSAARITAIMTGIAYATSAEMAGELGAFPGYAAEPRAHAARHPQPPPRRAWRGGRL